MKILQNLCYFKEMAYSKKTAIRKIEDVTEMRIEHLIKIFAYFDFRKDDINHWIDEIVNWSWKSPLLKGNTHLKQKELYRILWKDPKDSYTERRVQIFLNALQRKGYPHINYNYSNLINYLEDFNKWLSEELSEGDIFSYKIESKILELVKKYRG